jgi:hypothetical protein
MFAYNRIVGWDTFRSRAITLLKYYFSVGWWSESTLSIEQSYRVERCAPERSC